VYRLRLDSEAEKALDRLQGATYQRVVDALLALRETPRPPGCVRLRGHDAGYRIRIGSYRVLYEVDDASRLVTVWRIGHRRDVYRDL